MKKAMNRVHHSTNLVQAKHAISVRKVIVYESPKEDSNDITWLEMDSACELSCLRRTLLSTNKSRQANSSVITEYTASKLDTTKRFTNQQESLNTPSVTQNVLATGYLLFQSISNWVSGVLSPKIQSNNLQTFDKLVENILQTSSSQHEDFLPNPGEVLNIITLLDTGGQPECIHLLPTINIHPMVNFLVHDLSKSLDDQVLVEYSEHGKCVFEPYHLRYSNFDMIKFLMSTINDSLERPACQVPQLVTIPAKNTSSYICCVGTHADKVTPEIIYSTDNKLTGMVEKLDCKAAVWPNKDGGVLFPADNTTAGDDDKEDPIANIIRSNVEKLSLDKDVYELPITWMLLELEIRQVCYKNKKPCITFQECHSIALDSNLISETEQVKSALLYHHLLGVLLYYPEVPGLCDYVIIDHQWLFDRLSSIVCLCVKKSFNLQAANKLKYNGILSKELIAELKWEDELKQEYFLSLLLEMKIIAPIQREDDSEEDYFIPYVLPTYTSQSQGDDILSQYGYLQGEPLLIQFVSNLLPRGFFCCLVVQLLQNLPREWKHQLTQKNSCHSYSNLVTFCLSGAYFVSLIDKLSYLEVQIRHKEVDYYHKCPVHLAVQDVLASALELVCEQLGYSHGRLQYGFLCQCGEMIDEHIAIAELTPPFDYALCRYGSVAPTKLKHTHMVWLTEVSQT